MRRWIFAPLLVAILLLAAAPAAAGPPPRGLYECTIGGILFGDIVIKRNNTYKRYGRTGRFASRGRKLNFTTGPLKGFKGHWEKFSNETPVVYEIALRNPLDDFESIYCDK